MKNKGKVLVVFVLGIAMLFLVSCENTDEISNLEKQNKELVEKMKVMEEVNDSLSREIESLENDLNFLKFALEHCSSIAFTKDSLYRIDKYLGIVFIKEFTSLPSYDISILQ